MRIDDITVDSKITITVTKGLNRLQFETKVLAAVSEGLIIEDVMHEDKAVNFCDVSRSVIINVITVDYRTEKPYEWKDVEIKKVEYLGERHCMVVADDSVECMNRRGGYRVYLGLNGIAQIGENKCAHEVIVKDISEFGIGLVCKHDLELKGFDAVRVNFYDDKMDMRITINAVVVRKAEVAENKFVYGCRTEGSNKEVRKYISDKQMDRLKGKGRFAVYRR